MTCPCDRLHPTQPLFLHSGNSSSTPSAKEGNKWITPCIVLLYGAGQQMPHRKAHEQTSSTEEVWREMVRRTRACSQTCYWLCKTSCGITTALTASVVPTGQWDSAEPTGLSSPGMAKHKNLSLAAVLLPQLFLFVKFPNCFNCPFQPLHRVLFFLKLLFCFSSQSRSMGYDVAPGRREVLKLHSGYLWLVFTAKHCWFTTEWSLYWEPLHPYHKTAYELQILPHCISDKLGNWASWNGVNCSHL